MAVVLQLVPHRAGTTSARLWAGALTDGVAPGEVRLRLEPGGRTVLLPAGGWRLVQAGGDLSPAQRRVFVQVAEIDGLAPGTEYAVSGPGAAAVLCTLPTVLPRQGERPFTLLLASCFHSPNDAQGSLGAAVRRLPPPYQPQMKVLIGDQVYLDLPTAQNFLDQDRWLGEDFLGKYVRTFFQKGGFSDLLSRGATYFTPDDHEYWNNFPNPFPLAENTWTASGRARWSRIACDLYRDFQSDDPPRAGRNRRFSVGPLSFLIVDVRTHRGTGDGGLLFPEDLREVLAWLRELPGPGVLCIGQPIFDTGGGWFTRTFKDRSLPDYPDYGRLCEALCLARHSVVVLTGDVHYGRVARCELPGGNQLIEIISSPTSLCNPLVGGRAHAAPPRFPDRSDLGVPQRPTQTVYTTADENFATLQFSERGGRTWLALRYWFPRSPRGPYEDVKPILLD